MRRLAQRYALPTLILMAAVAFAVVQGTFGGRTRTPGAPLPGEVAPPFKARSLTGKTVDFPAGYRGKLVLLDFWATWCGPCRAEIPHLVEAYEKFHEQGLEIVGVSLDAQAHVAPPQVQRFAREHNMPWEQIYADAARIGTDYRVREIPAAFLLDGDSGRLLADGDDVYGNALLKTIAEHLSAKDSKP